MASRALMRRLRSAKILLINLDVKVVISAVDVEMILSRVICLMIGIISLTSYTQTDCVNDSEREKDSNSRVSTFPLSKPN